MHQRVRTPTTARPTLFATLADRHALPEVTYLLTHTKAESCGCDAFRSALGTMFVWSRSGCFLLCRPHAQNPHLRVQDVAARALRRCPFDGRLLHPELNHPAYKSPGNTPPLCCLWMAAVVEEGRMRFPAPDHPSSLPVFVMQGAAPATFKECPRCDADLAAIVEHRRDFLLRTA